MKVFAIIPAYNEAKRISKVITGIKKYTKNIIVINDGSTDNTSEIAEKHKVIVLKHIINIGKGAALKTGCDYAVKQKAEIIIAIDADGQHEPIEIPKFIEKIKEGKDIVFGYRIARKSMPWLFKFGNKFINFITQILYGIKIKDTQCGYRAWKTKIYNKIRWEATDYFMESEMIARVGKNKLEYAQIPIKTIYADKYKGTTFFDGLKIVFNMILWRITR